MGAGLDRHLCRNDHIHQFCAMLCASVVQGTSMGELVLSYLCNGYVLPVILDAEHWK